jgi:hypothetical protein
MRSRHHPNGDGVMHCNSDAIEAALQDYQSSGSTAALDNFLAMAQERALTLIRYNHVTRYRSEAELMSDINFRLLKAARTFNPSRGSGFTYLSAIVTNVLRTNVTSARKHLDRFVEFDEHAINTIPFNESRSQELLEDIGDRLRRTVKTQLTDPDELEAQRWLVGSFCAEGFESRRHSCANATMRVFGLTHSRARELYDLTMLEVRRSLYDLKPRQPIRPGQLFGRRCAWMSPYAKLLDAGEFTKFVVLMRDLAPYMVLLILDPAHENNHRRDRNPTIGRRNLELILYGSAEARLLFGRKSGGYS